MAERYQFHVVSFEGPDPYASAGGIGTRVTGLASAIAACGFDVHLWFVGDPGQPGHDTRDGLHLHRWCQWISAYHPGGVYDGEERKREDFSRSLPPYLFKEVLLPHLTEEDTRAVVLAEEWQTTDAVLHLDWLLRSAGLRSRVCMLWNANNTFGFDGIDWPRLTAAAVTTTVSRYMRFEMIRTGVDPLIIPNGLPRDAFYRPGPGAVRAFHSLFDGRLVLAKVARWDPAKRWLLAVDTTAELKRTGAQPLLIARGGAEAHGSEVRQRAASAGLKLLERNLPTAGEAGLLRGLQHVDDADMVVLDSPLDSEAKKLLFHASAAVLAHSGHEPFGLVGLETMAVAGVACTGLTGEDYAVAGWNTLPLQRSDPRDFVRQLQHLRQEPGEERALRHNGLATALGFGWSRIITRFLLPHVGVEVPCRSPADTGLKEVPRPASMLARGRYPRRKRLPRRVYPLDRDHADRNEAIDG
jgi:glycosyltransferase involved in cell wall biosynthesis